MYILISSGPTRAHICSSFSQFLNPCSGSCPSTVAAPRFLSSHGRAKWILDPQELFGATLMEVDADGSLSVPDPQINSKDNALIYFKRFYLQWSVMQHNPKYVILEFDLIVYAPYRSVKGYVNDMEELFHENTEMLQMLKETAMSEIDNIMLTDAPLLFPPGQLALAALRRSNQGHGAIDFDRHLDSILSRQKSAHTIYELFERINSIESWSAIFVVSVTKKFLPSNDNMGTKF
ncbi:Cyclin-H1-1, partial [Cucurbita argyrosperma subsp. argyrosperma]